MERDDRKSGAAEQASGRAIQPAQRPAPGKVTRTSQLASHGPAVQRKAATTGSPPPSQARSAWDLTMDPWMDAAHRGLAAGVGTQDAGPVQRAGGSQAASDSEVTASAQAGIAGGSIPLPHKASMEAAFGVSFDGVQAHAGPEAQTANEAIGARAYTSGSHVAFSSPNPDPGLVAHELTHVVQQSGRMQPKMAVGTPGDAYEQEADAVAQRVVAGQSVRDVATAHLGGGEVSAGAAGAVQGDFLDDVALGAKNTFHDVAEGVGLESHDDAEAARVQAFIDHGLYGPQTIDPGTGIGNGFDASYDPVTGVEQIVLRTGITFIDGLTLDPTSGVITPGSASEADLVQAATDGMALPVADRAAFVARFQWNTATEDAFITDLQASVEGAWSSGGSGISFQCTRPGWSAVTASVSVDVDVHRGAKADNDHASATVFRVPDDGSYSIGAFVGGDQINLGSTDVRGRPDNLLRRSVQFEHDSAVLSADEQAALQGFTSDFLDASLDLSNPVELVGHASSSGSDEHNQKLAQKRIDAVKNHLASVGFTGVNTRVTTRNEGENGATEDAEWRRVDLVVGNGQAQVVSSHEFGHAFGLDDEYAINPGGNISGTGNPTGTALAHDGLSTAIGAGGAVAENNDDIMSLGNVVRPRDYATFGLALRQVTGIDEWQAS